MKFRKSDWTLIREAEAAGLMVGMNGTVERNRTELNNNLSDYFRKQMPKYSGSFDENVGEDILYNLNKYFAENKIDKRVDFPFTDGTEVYLIPINENIQLKLLVSDEYHGGGEYSKFVMADFFMINESATTKDVDELMEFIKEYLTVE